MFYKYIYITISEIFGLITKESNDVLTCVFIFLKDIFK